jgi:hypothetical protein
LFVKCRWNRSPSPELTNTHTAFNHNKAREVISSPTPTSSKPNEAYPREQQRRQGLCLFIFVVLEHKIAKEAVLLLFVFTRTKHNTYFRYHHPKRSERNFIVTFINEDIAEETHPWQASTTVRPTN